MAVPKLDVPNAGDGVEEVLEVDRALVELVDELPKPSPDVVCPPNAPKPVAGFSILPKELAELNPGVVLEAGVGVELNAPNIPVTPEDFDLSDSLALLGPPRDNPPKPVSVGVSVDMVSSAEDMLDIETAMGDATAGLAGGGARELGPGDDGGPNLDGPAEANAPNAPEPVGWTPNADVAVGALPKDGCPKLL